MDKQLVKGIHHLAIMTADIKSQIQFFSNVMGLKLKALYWMHGVEGFFHAFMELNSNASIAFVFSPTFNKVIGIAIINKPYFKESQIFKININGDPSSAAFFTALTILGKRSTLKIVN